MPVVICAERKNQDLCAFQISKSQIASKEFLLLSKVFCYDCILNYHNEDMNNLISRQNHWRCPIKRKICKCKNCKGIYEKRSYDDYGLSKTSKKAILTSKIRNALDSNGTMILKYSKTLPSLSEKEKWLYLMAIEDNLKTLSNLVGLYIYIELVLN